MFGQNFIGVEEIANISSKLGIKLPIILPEIPFTNEELIARSTDSILILGSDMMNDGKTLNLFSLRELFGIDPDKNEPCFYNQDWYLNEDFMQTSLENRWYLISKNVFEESRSVLPSILEKKYNFPLAILCAYTFFIYWFHNKKVLWQNDFIWCADFDHNGDRIYVGKYTDSTNKNGFSIHRHLALRDSYATITVYQ